MVGNISEKLPPSTGGWEISQFHRTSAKGNSDQSETKIRMRSGVPEGSVGNKGLLKGKLFGRMRK